MSGGPAINERSPLLPTVRRRSDAATALDSTPQQQQQQQSESSGSSGAQVAGEEESTAGFGGDQFTEDDIAIEGMVMVLLVELEQRGYLVPSGLQTRNHFTNTSSSSSSSSTTSAQDGDTWSEPSKEELEQEQAIFRKAVFDDVERHRRVLSEYLPRLSRPRDGDTTRQEDRPGRSSANDAGCGPNAASTLGNGDGQYNHGGNKYSPNRPSPLAFQTFKRDDLSSDEDDQEHTYSDSSERPQQQQTLYQVEDDLITSPSALFLCALLSLLISLQAAPTSQVQETDRGVDGELRMFKARRELGERLYAVVGGLLDSYLLSGDHRRHENDGGGGGSGNANGNDEDDGEDALVTLLFHDFALYYDTTDRATCGESILCASFLASFHPCRCTTTITDGWRLPNDYRTQLWTCCSTCRRTRSSRPRILCLIRSCSPRQNTCGAMACYRRQNAEKTGLSPGQNLSSDLTVSPSLGELASNLLDRVRR